MGQCTSCLFGSSNDESPDLTTRRAQQAEAAEKRRKENEGRGIKDPEALKKKMQKREEMEKNAGPEKGEGLRGVFTMVLMNCKIGKGDGRSDEIK